MENNIQVLQHIRQDIAQKLEKDINRIIASLEQQGIEDYSTTNVLENLDLKQVEKDILEKYNLSNERNDPKFSYESEIWSPISTEECSDLETVTQFFKKDRSTTSQLNAVNALLSMHYIDTKHKYWLDTSNNLQQCLLSLSDDVFNNTLKTFYKIISVPSTSCEGYMSLLEGVILMFSNNPALKTKKIDLKNKIHIRTFKIFRFIAQSLKFMSKIWMHTKEKVTIEILSTFIYLLINNTNYNEKSESLSALDFLSVIDPESKWFVNLIYGYQTRHIVLNHVRNFNTLVTHEITALCLYMNSFVNTTQETIIQNQFFFKQFSHCVHFLSEYFKYGQLSSVFPLSLKIFSEPINIDNLIMLLVNYINRCTYKIIRPLLVQLLMNIITKHTDLLCFPEIFSKLFQQLIIKVSDKKRIYDVVQHNKHALEILNFVSKTQFGHLYIFQHLQKSHEQKSSGRNKSDKAGSSKSRSTYSSMEKSLNPMQIIINLTISSMRFYINQSENEHRVNETVFDLMSMCENLYNSHSKTFYVFNPSKLLTCTNDFYQTVTNHDSQSTFYKIKIVDFLLFFLKNWPNSIQVYDSDVELLQDVVTYSFKHLNGFKNRLVSPKLIINVSRCKEGCTILAAHYDFIIKPFLQNIWNEVDDEETLLEQNISFDNYINKFLYFIHALSYNFKAIETFLSYENEGTIVLNDHKALTLSELIENCLDIETSYLGTIDVYLGLLLAKVLLTNLDVMIYLQSSYQLQENMIEIQVNSRISCCEDLKNSPQNNSAAIVIDQYSSLRHNILLSIKYAGFVDPMMNENILKQTQLSFVSSRSSSTVKKHHKAQNELQKFLHVVKSGLHDHSWSIQARRAFKISCNEPMKMSVVIDVFDQIPKTIVYHKNHLTWPLADSVLLGLFPEDYFGVSIVVRFGVQNGFLPSMTCEENLVLLLRQSRTFLNNRPETFIHFDWFVAVIFVICGGNLDKCKNILTVAVNTHNASILWHSYGEMTNLQTSHLHDNFYQYLDMILEDTTRINSALKILELTPSCLVKKWLNQCFFNILEFNEVCNFIILCILYPPEHILFFILAVFEHLKEHIFSATHSPSLQAILSITQVYGFRVRDYFDFMEKLSKLYKNILKS